MKRNNIIIALVVGAIVVIVINSFYNGKSDAIYFEELSEHRQKKDKEFRFVVDSPFADNFKEFTSLKYYKPDTKYKIRAKFVEIENKKIVRLSTSDSKTVEYLEYGYVEFDLDQVSNKLLLLEMVEDGFSGSLFLAFGDATSADETYGAGRYLDIEHDGAAFITLDFNYAYNPYCAYTDAFSCPFPPPENLLEIAIRAGEMNY